MFSVYSSLVFLLETITKWSFYRLLKTVNHDCFIANQAIISHLNNSAKPLEVLELNLFRSLVV